MIEINIDLSKSLTIARNQGPRGACLAFAASDMNQFKNQVGQDLSVEYLFHHAAKLIGGWTQGDGLTVAAVVSSLAAPGQPSEISYPYQATDHGMPLLSPPALVPLYTAIGNTAALAIDQIVTTVQSGVMVCVIVAVSDALSTPKNGVVTDSPNYFPNVAHAMIVVGIGVHKTNGRPYFLVRNSWGDKWGIEGHAWLSRTYFEHYLRESFTT
jgi:C1A family cysteine protease